jgi:hypothetical protein
VPWQQWPFLLCNQPLDCRLDGAATNNFTTAISDSTAAPGAPSEARREDPQHNHSCYDDAPDHNAKQQQPLQQQQRQRGALASEVL